MDKKALSRIDKNELVFTNDPTCDRVNTLLELNDYDWMHYKLHTRFTTKAAGVLHVRFEYFGATTSQMYVLRDEGDGNVTCYAYNYSTDLFEKHIAKFLLKHLSSWKETYAFNGEDEVVDFFNDVLTYGEELDAPRGGESKHPLTSSHGEFMFKPEEFAW